MSTPLSYSPPRDATTSPTTQRSRFSALIAAAAPRIRRCRCVSCLSRGPTAACLCSLSLPFRIIPKRASKIGATERALPCLGDCATTTSTHPVVVVRRLALPPSYLQVPKPALATEFASGLPFAHAPMTLISVASTAGARRDRPTVGGNGFPKHEPSPRVAAAAKA